MHLGTGSASAQVSKADEIDPDQLSSPKKLDNLKGQGIINEDVALLNCQYAQVLDNSETKRYFCSLTQANLEKEKEVPSTLMHTRACGVHLHGMANRKGRALATVPKGTGTSSVCLLSPLACRPRRK